MCLFIGEQNQHKTLELKDETAVNPNKQQLANEQAKTAYTCSNGCYSDDDDDDDDDGDDLIVDFNTGSLQAVSVRNWSLMMNITQGLSEL
ncbi:HDR134Cp [Eremothecium sinecaudum]|uniref:HDR134Cp n=1 Tax=Eremothecium sinecaudum TaxID=45286 RepID=A0A0X8HS76_9SACH|nr:HDR134Cp [Eremothecium sinecaudum]AMD20876.1 HDR134Cp [Eremothecium sinecaudum]